MSKITTLLVIFACLTTALALNATLTKNYFFVTTNNWLSYKLFHTNNGIIAYNLEYGGFNASIPQYLLLDPTQGYATPILEDLLISCDQVGGVVFDRLQYHVQTSTLAYFCTANNSLLILDQKTYAVLDAIPTGISTNFAEAKLTADGSSLYVLLMGIPYRENQVPSQLVQFNLATKTVITNVVFDQGLRTQEYVTDFASQNNESYALTNIYNYQTGSTTTTIYSISFTDNTYKLVQIATWAVGGNLGFLTLFFQVGDYLVINNMKDLYFLNKQGETVSTYNMINSKNSYATTVSLIPAMMSVEGSSDIYVLFWNETLVKFTTESGNIVSENIGTAYDFQIAFGNQEISDLLFTINVYQNNFMITNLENSEVIYSMPNSYDDIMITNSTFGILQDDLLQVFNLETNAPIGNVTIPASFYLHKETDTLYFSQTENGDTTCVIKQLNLITLSIVEIQTYPDSELCSDAISQFNLTDNGYPEFVGLDQIDNLFTIVTQPYGIVQFNLSEFINDIEYIVADFDNMSLYKLVSGCAGSCTAVLYYEYNGTNFTLKNSHAVSGPPVLSYYASENDKAFAFSKGSFKTIDLKSGSSTDYPFTTAVKTVSSFKDNAGNEHLIFSDWRDAPTWGGNNTMPTLFDSNGVSQLPGTNKFTVQAGAGGLCSYWLVDGFISSVGYMKFYDACSRDNFSIFSIIQ